MKTWTMVEGYRDENSTWQHRLLCDGALVMEDTYTAIFEHVLADAAEDDRYTEKWSDDSVWDGEPVVTLRARHEDQQRQTDGEISMEEYYRRWPPAPAWMSEATQPEARP